MSSTIASVGEKVPKKASQAPLRVALDDRNEAWLEIGCIEFTHLLLAKDVADQDLFTGMTRVLS